MSGDLEITVFKLIAQVLPELFVISGTPPVANWLKGQLESFVLIFILTYYNFFTSLKRLMKMMSFTLPHIFQVGL